MVPQDSYHAAAWELLAHQCDYAVVDELFLQEGRVEDGGLAIGPGRFDAVLLPAVKIVEAETWAHLAEFAAAGGKVIALGEGPSSVMEPDGTMRDAGTMPRLDLVRCASTGEWLSQCVRTTGPLVACEGPAEKLYVQARQEGGARRWLLANLDVARRDYRLQFASDTNLVVYDPWSATVEERPADAEGRVAIAIDGGAAVIVERRDSNEAGGRRS